MPNTSEDLVNVAREYEDQSQFEKALTAYTEAIQQLLSSYKEGDNNKYKTITRYTHLFYNKILIFWTEKDQSRQQIITANVNSLLSRSAQIREQIEWQEKLDKHKISFLEEEHLYTEYTIQQKRLSFPPPYENPPSYHEAVKYKKFVASDSNNHSGGITNNNDHKMQKISKMYENYQTNDSKDRNRMVRNEITVRPIIMPPEYIKMPIRPLPPVSYTISRSFSSYANIKEKQLRLEKSKSTSMLKRQSVRFGKTFEEIREMIGYMLSTGIRTSVIKIMGSEIADPFQTNQQLPRQHFPFSDKHDQALLTNASYPAKFPFSFYDYSHILFRELRNQNNIDCDHYVHSLASDPDGLSLEVMLSEGKSSANFYRSTNGEFVVKTLSESEFEFFNQILPSYMQVCFEISFQLSFSRIFWPGHFFMILNAQHFSFFKEM